MHKAQILVPCLVLHWTVSLALTGQTVEQQFFHGCDIWKAGEKLEREGERQSALEKYLEAHKVLCEVRTLFPEWRADIVNFQLNIVEQAMVRAGHAGGAQLSDAAIAPPGAAAVLDTSPSPPDSVTPGNANPLPDRKTQQDGRDKERTIADLQAKAKTATDAFHMAVAEWQKAQGDVAAVKQQSEELVSRMSDPKGLATILAENAQLKQKLEDAQRQVDALKVEDAKNKTVIASLQMQLTNIQREMARLRQENAANETQVADLTMKLKKLNSELEQQSAKADQKLVEENKSLRNIIIRHLRQQERLRLSKELVIAEMKKMENVTQGLMEHLEDMTSGKVWITVDEESLFTEPELEVILALSGPSTNTLQAVAMGAEPGAQSLKTKTPTHKIDGAPSIKASSRPKPAAPPPNSSVMSRDSIEDRLLIEANVALENKNLPLAEAKLQDVLRANPKNIAALIGLAGINLDTKKYDGAGVLLQKCLVYDPDNANAAYLLGVIAFRQGKLADATSFFERALKHQSNNAKAHQYLGIIASQLQNRERAEAGFKNALAIDPNYADAHFNLAALYATSSPPDLEKARQHYREAIDRQVPRNEELERLIYPLDAPQTEPVSANEARPLRKSVEAPTPR